MRKIALLLIGLICTTSPAFAQVDLTGSWAPRLYEDFRLHANLPRNRHEVGLVRLEETQERGKKGGIAGPPP